PLPRLRRRAQAHPPVRAAGLDIVPEAAVALLVDGHGVAGECHGEDAAFFLIDGPVLLQVDDSLSLAEVRAVLLPVRSLPERLEAEAQAAVRELPDLDGAVRVFDQAVGAGQSLGRHRVRLALDGDLQSVENALLGIVGTGDR